MTATTRIRWLTFGSVLVTALAISITSILGMQGLLRESRARDLEHDVLRESERLRLALHESQHDVRLLAALPAARTALLRGQSHAGPPAADAAVKDQLASVFREMLRSKPTYTQVRLIGVADDGRELVRVDRSADAALRVAEADLQAKGTRPYFRKAIEAPAGEVYVSPISLNRERGRIQHPLQPVLRVAMRVDNFEGEPLGVVVINQDFNLLTKGLFPQPFDSEELFLTNAAGDYLLHPNPAMAFGFDLGTRRLLQVDFPNAARLFRADGPGEMRVAIGDSDWGRLQLRRVPLLDTDPESFVVLAMRQRRGFIDAGGFALVRRVVLVTVALCALASVAAVVVGRMQTEPIDQVTRAAEHVARGEVLPALPVRLANQMGALARAVQGMNDALISRQHELERANRQLEGANENLEHFVQIAAHDFREPLRKQRKLIDLLAAEQGVSAETEELLGLVAQCSQHMQCLVDDFRAVSNVGRSASERQTLCMRELVEDVLAGFRHELDPRSVRVEWEELPTKAEVYPDLVRLLYENLIDNALRHSSGATITLRFTARRRSGRWWYGVLNTGSTIAAEKLDDVFKVFRRDSDAAGNGIGLSLCRKVAEWHHGEIAAETDANSVHIYFTLEEVRVAQLIA